MKHFNTNITKEKTGLILHGVNCQGVMGSGVAKAIKKKWPRAYKMYLDYINCYHGQRFGSREHLLGNVNYVWFRDSLIIANGFTQLRYGNDGKVYADKSSIISVLHSVCNVAIDDDLQIKMVPIGCGLGGLDKKWLFETIEDIESKYGIEMYVYDIDKDKDNESD